MHKYALLTKINENDYEVFDIVSLPDDSLPVARIEPVINSGKTIYGMKTTQFGNKATNGSIWTGSDFIDWNPDQYPTPVDWNIRNSFSFLCDNKIFFMGFTTKNTVGDDMFNAAFTNSTTLIKVIDDVLVGDIWNGTSFRKPE